MKRILALLVVLSMLMFGCSPTMGPKEGAGTLLGAGTGALL